MNDQARPIGGYDFTKSEDRYRWKCDKTHEIVERFYEELCKSSERHTVIVDGKCVLDNNTIDLMKFRDAAYRLFRVSLE